MSHQPSWRLNHPVPAAPHHRHQTSLEDVVDMSSITLDPLAPPVRQAARQTFYRVVEYFEAIDPHLNNARDQRVTTYSQPRLVRFTYEYALSDNSRDVFLRAFFGSMALAMDSDAALDFQELAPRFAGFAEYLMDYFFLPLKASTRKTPQPSPAYRSAFLFAQGGSATGEYVMTPDRLSTLRGACLVRDRHRCVISRKFHVAEFKRRLKQHGREARDDDGALLIEQQGQFDILEVAHILPHSLMKADAGAGTDAARQAALSILNMFDTGVTHMIDGVDIDRPRNALTLTTSLHADFGAFEIYFDPVLDQNNTYRIQSFTDPEMNVLLGLPLPVTRTLFLTEDHTIEPPSPRLLAIHRAIAHILHLSGAGEYIERVLYDMEDSVVRADGTSELGRMVRLGLSGWVDGAVC
ncbi:hypothetical protein SPI_09492 [Niveomyces insectorum RCEF 264]|uniref:HNH nuclease domain-containing protein n=1 Tax=Niveomyces insectorum RCEF 264 TaxID=1081102 RepID=A0A167LEV2_9HYPO|nr:hypothetical protein SPI_09492 [Niveomyces insectorum RCEF 264]